MSANATAIELTRETFTKEVLESDVPVLVDFWAEWCGPCRVIAPAIDALAEEYAGRARVGRLNVDDEPEIAAEYGIRSIPALFYFKDGRKVDELIGAAPKEALAAKLDALL